MQKQQPDSPTRDSIHAPKYQPKVMWHRPTIRFVSLQATASDIGSGIDASDSTDLADALDDSVLK